MAGSGESFAQKRVALVIGNSEYQHAPKLSTPANDANAIGTMLEGAGFDVVERRNNLTSMDMRRALRDFSQRVRDADVAVVFYSGHAIEIGGSNFLIPTDAKLDRDIDVEDEAISLDRLMNMVEPARRLRLVILDACRDNPFVERMKRNITSRSIGRGLAEVDPIMSDMLVALAAKAGSTAFDGEGNHSHTALLQHLAAPGLDVRFAFVRIRDDVIKMTNNLQQPMLYGALENASISLVPGGAGSGRSVAEQHPVDDSDRERPLRLLREPRGDFWRAEELKRLGIPLPPKDDE
jgi:uncharacterized caspase-like protein